MSIRLTSCLLWIMFISRVVKGQSNCDRTNRQPNIKCVAECNPATGCGGSGEQCLCDGDCGYSCVKRGLSCGRPPPVFNAKRVHPSTNFGAVVTYVCNQGFTLTGASQRTCRANGKWDGVGPNCLKVCTVPAIPFSMYIAEPKNYHRTYSTGDKITLACKKGFKKKAKGNPVRICISGRWTQFPFECEGTHACKRTVRPARTKCTQECSPESGCGSANYLCLCDGGCGYSCVEKGMSCGDPPAITNGKLNSTGTEYNSTAHYTCDEGYSLNTAPVKRCTAKKRWSGLTPRCMKDCKHPAIPRYANISNPSDKYNSGYKVTFKCNEGYNQEGIATQMCFQGKWTVLPFKCSAVNCGPLLPPKNGSSTGKETTFTKTITFKCDAGFNLTGSFSRTCMADKTWSDIMPVCKAVDCGRLPTPMNGSLLGEETTYPNQVEISCDEGFILRGSRRRTCQVDGTWSEDNTLCEAVDCGQVQPPINGSLLGNYTFFPNKLHFYCDVGFLLRGSSVRRCLPNATWSGIETKCEAKNCGSLITPTNGSMFGRQTTFPSEVRFSCEEGFLIIGPEKRKCQADGSWSGNVTLCAAVDCGRLLVPVNGSSHGGLTVFPESIRFSCDTGFIMSGSPLRHCRANGTWSGNETSCNAVDCGRLPPPVNGSVFGEDSTYPNTIQFTCDDGFTLHGATRRNCQSNGTWSGSETICQANDCGPLAVPRNGSSVGIMTTYPNKIVFSCDEGFILIGSAVRQCQANKIWNGLDTHCKAIDCGPLAVPINGSSAGNLTVFPNKKLFKCEPGYILGGSSERVCQASGTWSGTNTTCTAIDCGFLFSPRNGSVHGERTTYPNTVRFICDEGFTLLGSTKRTCQTNGAWSGTKAVCKANDCGPLAVPRNGSSVGNMTTYPNKIVFSCDEGFILIGSAVRQCQANKTWNGLDTYCKAVDCGPLRAPVNGSLIGNLTVFPNSVQFACDPGFILTGSVLRTCQANGTWGGLETACSAVDCGPLVVPKNGSVFGEKTMYPNLLKFKCDEGFTLHGSHARKCQANGTWSGVNTFCQANDCGRLSVPMNGTLSGNVTTYPNKVTFTCDDGFILQGSATRQCQPDKRWSGNNTVCEAVDCGPLRAPLNGSLIGNLTVFPNSVQLKCDSGFILSGSTLRTCQTNGSWSGLETACNAVDCGLVQTPQNGTVLGELTTYPNLLQFYCDEGFTLYGSSTRKCQANGRWSGTNAFCQANDCGPLSVLINGTLSGNITTYPNKVTFTCDEGFILEGSAIRHCQPDKRWSGNDTFCKAKDCGPLAVPVNGSSVGSQTTFPHQIIFSCDEGFIHRGSAARKCQSNGTWNGNESYCEAKDCGALDTPTNGSLFGNLTTYPNEVKFACDEGYNLRGSKTRQCLSNGNWSGNKTLCEAEDCGPLRTPTNGSSSDKKTTYPNRITFRCDDGFILRGSVIRRCQPNGTWSGDMTFCEAKNCGPLHAPINGSSVGNEFTFPNKITFKCDEGFILKGSVLRKCQSNGQWTGNDTFCEAVDCGPLSSPMNGSLSGNLTVYPNNVRFKCDPGFILRGSSLRKCQPNGTWDGYDTVCEAVDCGKLHAPQNGTAVGRETTYPNIWQFSCDEGFILSGSSLRKCQTNGTWSGNTTKCQAQNCGPLPVPRNGSLIGDLTSFPNKILFDCDEGFNLRGSRVRQCQANGMWSGNQTFCEAVDCGPLSVPMNGSSSSNSTVFPNSVLFKCDPGFILNGSSIRTCQSNGTWSGLSTVCVAVDCGQAQPIQNGSIIGVSTVYPNVMRLICEEGFVLRGSPDIRCHTNGTWSTTSSFCEARDCGPLTVPVNGSYYGSKTTFPNVATFSCDEGFVLNGSTVRQCQADGNWSGTDTSCQAVDCGPLSAPRNGALLGNLTFFPNRVHFFCNNGYVLDGSSRKCLANGTWSGMQTACTPIDCGPQQPLLNGTLSGEMTDYPNIVKLTCDKGFILHGPPLIKCQANGSWSWFGAFCEAKNCGQLPKPLNGTVFGSETTYPNKLEFKCDEGFELQGSSTRKCEADGQWTGQKVTCQAVDCGPISVPEHTLSDGNSTTYPSVITFSCQQGFSLRGESTRMCQADGKWTSGEVLCRGMNCGPLTPPEHGWMFGSKTTHPHNMSFTCAAGYRLVGPSQRTCLRNGSWSGQQPKCLSYWCSKAPEEPMFAYQTWRTARLRYEHGERIYYSCKAGFIMVGIPVRFCNFGQWSAVTFNCSAPSCNAPTVPKLSYTTSARGSQNKYLNGEKVYYSCHSGYELVGIPMVECQNGEWTYPSFSCQPVACGTLPKPSNGAIQRNTGTTYTALYVFRCNAAQGYIMRGSAERRCLANATWSGVQPVCYMQTCDPRGKPRYGKVTPELSIKHSFGDTVHYQCNDGFSVRGHKTARCQIYGNWSNPVPECISCSSSLGLKNRMIFSRQLSASSARDSRHRARHGRLHGNSAWCSARSGLAKFFQIDFGRTTEVTAIATQGHPKEYKWVTGYVLKYSLGKQWLTYQESGRDKVFQGNWDRNTVVKHYLKEGLVTKQLRILRHQNSQDFMGSTVCLRAEVYGCYFDSDCLDVGSEVFARWNSLKKHTRYFHGFITKIRKTSVEVTPSGNHGAKVNDIRELPRAEKHYVVIDNKSKPAEITTGAEVIVASEDNIGFSQGKVGRIFGEASWFEVELSNKNVWRKANQIRLLKSPVYCDRE